MVDALVFYGLLIIGCACDVCHPVWWVWLIPVIGQLGKVIANVIDELIT